MERTVAAVLALALPALVLAEWETPLRFEVGTGYDSNALREGVSEDAASDGYLGGLARLRATHEGEASDFSATLTEGGKFFFTTEGASLIASRLELSAGQSLTDWLWARAELSGRDLTESGHVRDQNEARGALALVFGTDWMRTSILGGYALTAPRKSLLRAFLARGPALGATAAWTPTAEHSVTLGYDLWWKDYPRWEQYSASPGQSRSDRAHTLSATYAWQGSFVAEVGYALSLNTSTLDGGAYTRHRFTVRGAANLPFESSITGQASVQRSFYPHGTYAEELQLSDSDENQNAVELKLARKLGEQSELSLKLAYYRNELWRNARSDSDLAFRRFVAHISISWTLDP